MICSATGIVRTAARIQNCAGSNISGCALSFDSLHTSLTFISCVCRFPDERCSLVLDVGAAGIQSLRVYESFPLCYFSRHYQELKYVASDGRMND